MHESDIDPGPLLRNYFGHRCACGMVFGSV